MTDTRCEYKGIVTEIIEDTPDKLSFKIKDANYQDDIQFITKRHKDYGQLSGLLKIGKKIEISTESKAVNGVITIEGVKKL